MSAPITEASAQVLENAIARLHGAHDGDRIRTLHHSEANALLAHIAALKQSLTASGDGLRQLEQDATLILEGAVDGLVQRSSVFRLRDSIRILAKGETK